MANQSSDFVKMCVMIAKAMLHTRQLRRKIMLQLLVVLFTVFALGVFVFPGWLEQGPLRFLLYWGVCGLLCMLLILFCIYDMGAAYREVKTEHKRDMINQAKKINELLEQAGKDVEKDKKEE